MTLSESLASQPEQILSLIGASAPAAGVRARVHHQLSSEDPVKEVISQ
jgi:hypothetical protein